LVSGRGVLRKKIGGWARSGLTGKQRTKGPVEKGVINSWQKNLGVEGTAQRSHQVQEERIREQKKGIAYGGPMRSDGGKRPGGRGD